MTILQRIEAAIAALTAKGVSEAEIARVLAVLVNSPLVGLIVRLTPNAADDAVLAFLKAAFPPPQ